MSPGDYRFVPLNLTYSRIFNCQMKIDSKFSLLEEVNNAGNVLRRHYKMTIRNHASSRAL